MSTKCGKCRAYVAPNQTNSEKLNKGADKSRVTKNLSWGVKNSDCQKKV